MSMRIMTCNNEKTSEVPWHLGKTLHLVRPKPLMYFICIFIKNKKIKKTFFKKLLFKTIIFTNIV